MLDVVRVNQLGWRISMARRPPAALILGCDNRLPRWVRLVPCVRSFFLNFCLGLRRYPLGIKSGTYNRQVRLPTPILQFELDLPGREIRSAYFPGQNRFARDHALDAGACKHAFESGDYRFRGPKIRTISPRFKDDAAAQEICFEYRFSAFAKRGLLG